MISLEYAKALYDLGLETKQTKVFEQELATMLELLSLYKNFLFQRSLPTFYVY